MRNNLSDVQKHLCELVKENPGMDTKAISNISGLAFQTVGNQLSRLSDTRRIRRRKERTNGCKRAVYCYYPNGYKAGQSELPLEEPVVTHEHTVSPEPSVTHDQTDYKKTDVLYELGGVRFYLERALVQAAKNKEPVQETVVLLNAYDVVINHLEGLKA